ncbi:MAG: DUF1998 domain-containing protein, partial [Spirochaetota bacterium]
LIRPSGYFNVKSRRLKSFPAYLFDRYPGGTGLAEGLAQKLSEVIAASQGRLSACSCLDGCPSCIGVDYDSAQRGPSPLHGREIKPLVLRLFDALLGRGPGA